MKNLCPDIQFDGVQFQKLYEANHMNEENSLEGNEGKSEIETDDQKMQEKAKKEDEDVEIFSQTKTIVEFSAVIRN